MNVKNLAKGAADAVSKNFGKAKNAVGGAVDKAKDAVGNAVDKAVGSGRQLGSNAAIGKELIDKIPNQHVRGASSLAINAGIGAVGGGLVGMVAGEADDDSSKMKGLVAGAAIGAGVMTAGTLYMNKHDLQIAKGLTKDAMNGNKSVSAKATEVAEQVTGQVAGTNEAERVAAARAAFNERTGKNAVKPAPAAANMNDPLLDLSRETATTPTMLLNGMEADPSTAAQVSQNANYPRMSKQAKRRIIQGATPENVGAKLDAKRGDNDLRNMHVDLDGQYTFNAAWDSRAQRYYPESEYDKRKWAKPDFMINKNLEQPIDPIGSTATDIDGQMTINDYLNAQSVERAQKQYVSPREKRYSSGPRNRRGRR